MGKVWGGSSLRQGFFAATALVISLFSVSALASLDGSFSGSVTGQFSCSFPSVSVTPWTGGTYSLQATPSGSPGISNVTLSFSAPDLNYSGTGTATEGSPNDFNISVIGTLNLTTGISGINGPYLSAQYFVSAILNPDGTLSLDFGNFSGLSGACSGLNVDTDLTTLSSSSGQLFVDAPITPGTIVTVPQTLKSQVTPMVVDVHDRTTYVKRVIQEGHQHPTGGPKTSFSTRPTSTGFMMESITSLNAGDNTASDLLFGVWASYSYSDFENNFVTTAFDGERHGFLVGADLVLGEKTILGIAVGYEDNDIDTTFNRGNQETEGISFIPYFGYLLDDTWSVDGAFGYSNMETDQFRTAPGTTTRINSFTDADRWFGALNLNGFTNYDNWLFTGRFGILYANHDQDSFVESDGTLIANLVSELGQINIGGDVAYSYGEFEPFARVTYEYDWTITEVGVLGGGPQPSFDKDDVLIGAGVRYFGTNNISGNLEWNKRLGRDDYDEDSFSITIRADF